MLYAVNPDGSGRHAVTLTGPGYDPNTSASGVVRVSPDGTKLAFDDQDGRIWEANARRTARSPSSRYRAPVTQRSSSTRTAIL